MVAWGLSRGEVLNRMRKVHQNVVHVVRESETSAPRKYHAPLSKMVTCGQSWIIKNAEFAASM